MILTALAVLAAVQAWSADSDLRLNLRDELPAAWVDDSHFDAVLPSDDAWWKNFGDPLLDSLIAQGETNNFNVLIAARRMEIARQTLKRTKAAYLPTIDLGGGWTKSRTSGAMTSADAPASTMSYFDLGLDLNWQIDLFGKITARARESKAQWQATRAQYAAAMVALSGQIASAYFNLRMYQAERAVTLEHIESQAEVLKIVEARYQAGLSSKLDVAQARTVYSSTKATLPDIETSIHTTINAIAVLVGVTPDSIYTRLAAPREMPDCRMIVATGMPLDLLRRRPDIVEAQRNLASLAAAVGVAKKDFLPTLSLQGSVGTSAHNGKDLFAGNSLTYTIAPTLSWTVFDGLSRNYAVAAARENLMAGVDSYNLTVLTAVEEVDNAMETYTQALRHIDGIDEVIANCSESFRLSLELYKTDLTGFYNVVNAQMSLLNYANQLIAARGQALGALVNLYEALGGGWGEYLSE